MSNPPLSSGVPPMHSHTDTMDNESRTRDEKTRYFQDFYQLHHVSLSEGEYIIDVTSDHYISVIQTIAFWVVLAVGSLVALLYRSVAGDVFDYWNLALLVLFGISVFRSIWLYIECENDHVILTNQRVILSDRQVLGTYNIKQITLQNIQDVSSRTSTYVEHWMGFGTLIVQSVRTQLVFKGAERVQEVQKRIVDEFQSLRTNQNDQELRDVIATQVYGEEPTIKPYKLDITRSSGTGFLSRMLPENPQVEPNGTVTWRKHWFFLIPTLLVPVGIILVLFVTLVVVSQAGFIPSLATWIAAVLLALVFVGWASYETVDFVNDRYILSATNVVDIEKKPFGPEERREASLDAVQNVTNTTSLLGRILNYGDVFLETAGKGEFTFHHVPNPNEVVRVINNYQNEFRRKDKMRTLQNMAVLLKYYHDEQVRQGEIGARKQRWGTSSSSDNQTP